MRTILAPDREHMGHWVGEAAAEVLRKAIAQHGAANMVVATGASQFEVLNELTQQPDIDWNAVQGFHLDEYVGLSSEHPSSFCRYLKERFVDRVPLSSFHYLLGTADPKETIERVGSLVRSSRIDLALVGIGENGHLAFNDPPADFETDEPYLLVELDEPCRMQQVGEGWFETFEDVPTHAISMSVQQILRAERIFCSVPDSQKADAVRNTLEGPVAPDVPASILRTHSDTTLIIDAASAVELSSETLSGVERLG